MAWIEIPDKSLSRSERDNNAWMVYNYFQPLGWTVESIAAMCGNMELESAVNPLRRSDITAGAYGLVQWVSNKYKMREWCNNNGYNYASGEGQCAYLRYTELHPRESDQWYSTSQWPVSMTQFATNTNNYTVAQLTECFCDCFERPASDTIATRVRYAEAFYTLFQGTPPPAEFDLITFLLLYKKKRRPIWKGGRYNHGR